MKQPVQRPAATGLRLFRALASAAAVEPVWREQDMFGLARLHPDRHLGLQRR